MRTWPYLARLRGTKSSARTLLTSQWVVRYLMQAAIWIKTRFAGLNMLLLNVRTLMPYPTSV